VLTSACFADPVLNTLIDESPASDASALHYANSEGDPAVTSLLGAILRLGRTGDETAIVPLLGLEQRLRFAPDPVDLDRWAACVQALCAIRERVSDVQVDAITAALAHGITDLADPAVQHLACLALTIMKNDSASTALVAHAFDGRVEATRALGALQSPMARDGLTLIVATRAPTWRVALRKLCELGDERGLRAAQDLLERAGTRIDEIILALHCLKAFAATVASTGILVNLLGHRFPGSVRKPPGC